MCKETTHANLTQPEHFMRHTINVERYRSMARRAFDRLTLDDIEHAVEDAHEALLLADADITPECTQMLHLVEEGDLRAAAAIAS